MHSKINSNRTANWLAVTCAAACSTLFIGAAAAAEIPEQLQAVVKQGKELYTHPSFGGNGKACESCHRGGGMEMGQLPDGAKIPSLSNAAAIFPRYNKHGKLVTLEDQIRGCVKGAIEGTPPEYDSDEMRALTVYLTSLAQGKEIEMGGKPK